ncbi:LTA synthase family protein [Paenibacillus sp. GCM10023252]|uniref:LTA synthase family protein n=1 Tax=Paenibacillus sp. GCM10023252 TaxID=3252649 RepID=UPI0036079ECE
MVRQHGIRVLWDKPFVLFSLILLLKASLTYGVVFSEWTWRPLIADIPFVLLCFSLIEVMAKKRKLLAYMIVNFLVTAVYFAIIMYYKYYGVIVTYVALQQAGQVTEVKSSVMTIMHPYFMLIFVDIVLYLVLFGVSRKVRGWRELYAVREPRKLALSAAAVMLIVCLANVMPFRESINELKKSQQMGLLNYQVYSAVHDLYAARSSISAAGLPPVEQADIDALKGVMPPANPAHYGEAAGRNVIIIQLESFQDFLVGLKLDGKEITPNLNKLVSEHYYFPNFYQQVGQGNTSDAEYVVNSSLLIPLKGAASQEYSDKELPSLPKLVRKHGYESMTFHTNDVTFWNRNELYAALGFDKYYEREFFKDEDMMFFGSSDEVLYKRTSEVLGEKQAAGKPFYAHVISMSGHHPFDLPERKQQMELPARFENTFVGHYIQAQNYADYALGQFVDELKANGVWDNSLIVLYGDHLGLPIYSLTGEDKKLMQEVLGRPYDYAEMMNIPLVAIAPGITEPKVLEQVGGQSDILPTVANWMGFSLEGQIHFGQDLMGQSSNLLPQRYYLPSGSFIDDKAVFVPGNGFSDGKVYPREPGVSAAEAQVSEEQFERALKLLRLSSRYVEQLPARE